MQPMSACPSLHVSLSIKVPAHLTLRWVRVQ